MAGSACFSAFSRLALYRTKVRNGVRNRNFFVLKSLENETPHQNKFGAGHAFLAVFVLKQNFLASPVIHRGFLLGITGEIWFLEEGFLRCGI